MSTSREYHEYIEGCSVHRGDIMMHVGEQVDKSLSISIENPDVLMISPDVLMVSSDVLNTPQCTHGIPHMHHDIPRCTEHPPMYS